MGMTPGEKLGPYEITAPLGAGGMGEVWKARDPRLGRDVAVKIGREQFSERFEREARAVAALNHSNICQLYDVGPNYLVMEFVDGEALRGPLPLAEVLPIVEQLIDGIEAAHEKGIVHRDLKPANIKITPQGRVKILDFGLAKAAEPGRVDNLENSPTLTMGATRVGMILGTAAYMSPEQARGKTADRRSDIWSFGVVVYELLTGQRLFQGEDTSEMLAAVIKEEPNVDAAPAQVRRLLRACLQKDPQKRLQAIGDARLLVAEPAPVPMENRQRGVAWVPWLATGILAVLAALGWFKALEHVPVGPGEGLTLSIVAPGGTALASVGGLNIDRISPDGSAVLLRTSDAKFRVRALNNLDAQPVAPINPTGDPFWSPDSKSIALPTVNGLMKIHLPEGAPELISADSVAAARGGSWGEKGTILLAKIDSSAGGIGLYEVPAGGGKLLPITVPGMRNGRSYDPEFLSGGEDFLFAFEPSDSTETDIYWATLRDGKAANAHLLFKNDTAAQFTPAAGGRVLFVRNDNLYAQKVDLTAGKIIGDPELVQRHVVSNAAARNANFSVSRSGALAWRSGTGVVSEAVVFDRNGTRVGTAGSEVPVNSIRLSPDEAHLLAQSEGSAWIMEANGPGKIASPMTGAVALWAPDGSHFITDRGTEIVERAINSSGDNRRLAAIPSVGSRFILLNDVSAGASGILYGEQTGLFLLRPRGGRTEPERLVNQRVDNAAISPDGTWVVYCPRAEPGIYVQPLMSVGFRKQIAASGNFPVWRKDGKEILYYDQGRVWSVRVEGAGGQFRFTAAEALFPVARPMGVTSGSRPLAVNHDGSRIYFLQSAEQPDSGVIHIRTHAIR